MNSIRIAIATTDGVSVCDHLARSAAFLIFQVDGGTVVSWSSRFRGTDACGNHKSFVDLADGCRALICGGIGGGAANALMARGIESLVTAEPLTVDEALARYLAGTLKTTDARVCLCG